MGVTLDPLKLSILFFLALVIFLGFLLVAGLSYLPLSRLFDALVTRFSPQDIYQEIVVPYRIWLTLTVIAIVLDTVVVALPNPTWLNWLEFPIGIFIALNVIILAFQLFEKLFNNYFLGVALEDRTKINSELIALGQYLGKATIVLSIIFSFSQTHHINLIGLVASLGVAGAAIAFASQKIIEEVLWSIVLFLDRPFSVDEYIHLPDRTLGKVESIGWRSTKIRLSGKNTLVIIPNSHLAQDRIENLTRAKRVISMVTLRFFHSMSEQEKALIQDLIVDSASDILGIDHDLTQVTFQEIVDREGRNCVRAQVIFFILGTTEGSMELRRGLLEIARENMTQKLQTHGITFDCEQSTVDVVQPMNI